MYKPFIKNLIASLVVATTILPISIVQAAKTDLNQEISITAKRQTADLKNKVASYLDDVIIAQGSLSIKADLVKVGTIPLGLIQHWKATEGIDVFNEDHWPKVVEKLNSNEFQALRVAQFKV